MSSPRTEAGRLLLDRNASRDRATNEWLLNDILAIEAEARAAAGAVDADTLVLKAIGPFGDHHPRGEARCECGWRPNIGEPSTNHHEHLMLMVAAAAGAVEGPDRRCIFVGCVSTDRHSHGGFPGGYDNPEDPDGPPIPFTSKPAPGVHDYNGALLPRSDA